MAETLHEFRPTWAGWFWLLVFTLGIALPYVWWRRRGVRYEITEDRVIKHTGRASSKTDEIPLKKVKRVETEQSFGEKILGGGTIELDTGDEDLTISAVPDHQSVVETIRENQ